MLQTVLRNVCPFVLSLPLTYVAFAGDVRVPTVVTGDLQKFRAADGAPAKGQFTVHTDAQGNFTAISFNTNADQRKSNTDSRRFEEFSGPHSLANLKNSSGDGKGQGRYTPTVTIPGVTLRIQDTRRKTDGLFPDSERMAFTTRVSLDKDFDPAKGGLLRFYVLQDSYYVPEAAGFEDDIETWITPDGKTVKKGTLTYANVLTAKLEKRGDGWVLVSPETGKEIEKVEWIPNRYNVKPRTPGEKRLAWAFVGLEDDGTIKGQRNKEMGIKSATITEKPSELAPKSDVGFKEASAMKTTPRAEHVPTP